MAPDSRDAKLMKMSYTESGQENVKNKILALSLKKKIEDFFPELKCVVVFWILRVALGWSLIGA